MPTGAELFVSSLQQLGIDRIFTLVGDHLNEVLSVAAQAGLKIIDMRHESGVTHAADAWARLTRKPALALVTGGPGHTNSLTGIATAFSACSPVIAVSGSRASTMGQRQAFQDLDQVPMTLPVTKWAAEVPAASQIPFYLGRAYAEAGAGRKGPVHLTVPADLFTSTAAAPARFPAPQPLRRSAPSPVDVEHALAALALAQRPVVIAGSGVWWSDAGAELTEFIERTSLPLYTVTMAKGLVSDDHPQCLGYADPALNRAFVSVCAEADLFLVLGKRIDYRLALGGPRLFPAGARIMQVDVHAPELGMNHALELGVCADVKAALRAMLDLLPEEKWQPLPWLKRLRTLKRDWQQSLAKAAEDDSEPIRPPAFFAELREHLPAGTLLSWDGGDFTHWGRAMTPALHAGGWLRLGPLATIGAALPNAISLKMANPEAPVALITGDGSLGFYLAELDTAVRHNVPFVVIVGNDAAWGIEKELQGATTAGPLVACELRPTRYDKIMQGFGGGGETITSLDQVGEACGRAFASGRPYLLNVMIQGTRSPFTDWQIAGKK